MFTQVTVYFKKCFMEIDSGCLRDEASRGLTYKRLNPKCYTQGGLHHQTHAHYGLDRRRHHRLTTPLYHHPHPSPSSHCITSHHSMVSFFHKVSHCGFYIGKTGERLEKTSCVPTGNIANVFQVFRAWAKLAMEYLQYVAFIYAMNLYIHIISTSHANLRNISIIYYIKNISIYISHLCTHVYYLYPIIYLLAFVCRGF